MIKSADISKKISDHVEQQAAQAKAEAQAKAQRTAKAQTAIDELIELLQAYQAPEEVDVTFDRKLDSQDVTLSVKHKASPHYQQTVTIMYRDTEWMFIATGGEVKLAPVPIAGFTADHVEQLVGECLAALAKRLGVRL